MIDDLRLDAVEHTDTTILADLAMAGRHCDQQTVTGSAIGSPQTPTAPTSTVRLVSSAGMVSSAMSAALSICLPTRMRKTATASLPTNR